MWAVLLCLFMTSCTGDEAMLCSTPEASSAELTLIITPVWSGEVIEAGSEFEDHFGNRLRLFNFKTYISEINLEGENDYELSEVELLNFNDGAAVLNFQIPVNSTFSSLKLSTGVAPEYNVDYDPSTWPNSHPLSVQGAQGMHWGWNTGYIFTKFDGKADITEDPDPTYLYPFTFHCGDDEFYTNHEFEIGLNSGEETQDTIRLILNSEKLLNATHNIDIREDGETHTGGDFQLAQEFIDNLNTAFELE